MYANEDPVGVVAAAERSARAEQRRKEYEKYAQSLRHQGLYSLAGEIDRCLKKVSEGIETFEDIWQKVQNATSHQKEKFETELKKEIKKLQRLRDQIKSWIVSTEFKDKSTLVDTRKLIETQMERFKVVERESKTKAYSNEGLGAPHKVDPTTRERDDLNNWLVSSIEQIQIQMDQMECEIEYIMAGKKKKLDKDKQGRINELKVSVDRHRFHLGKLETILRMLDNLSVDVNSLKKFLSQVKKIKDDIEYYLESSQEPEFEENEYLYDDIEGFGEFDDEIAQQNALANVALNAEGESVETPTCNTSGNNLPASPIHSRDSSSNQGERKKSVDDTSKFVLVRPVAMKANHGPNPGIKTVGDIGTALKDVVIPNDSSPSWGLSKHGSSSQILNYRNALKSLKMLSHKDMDCVEHNSPSIASGGVATRHALKSPLSKGSSTANSTITSLTEETSISTANALINDNGEREISDDHSSPPQLDSIENSSGSVEVVGKNGLFSSMSQDGISTVQSSQLEPLVVGSGSSSITNITDLSHQQQFMAATSFLETNSQQSTTHSKFSQPPGFEVLGTPGAGAVGIAELEAAWLSNSLFEPTIATALSPLNSFQAAQFLYCDSSSTHNSGTSNLLSQLEQIQQLQMQGSSQTESLSSHDAKPFSDYMKQPDPILLNPIPQDGGDAMTSLKTLAQDVLEGTCLNRGDTGGNNVTENKTQDAYIPPMLCLAPLGPVPLTKEHQYQLQMLEAAHSHLPVPADSERVRQFLPRNPISTPSYYPQHPMSNADSLEYYQALSPESLFFMFYYLEGSKAQYMAAKVLKMQNWRFHTKYLVWFKRHEQPTVINQNFEQGTYIYFDTEKWCQRKKEGFVFEYIYLEDRDLS